MDRIYILPKINYKTLWAPNPYMENLEKVLAKNFIIVNGSFMKFGVLELFQYLFITDSYVFNWIEDLHLYKFGKIQVGFFLIFILFKRIFKKKVIWVLHNKYTHFRKKNLWTDFMYDKLMKHSDLILTHSNEGITFVKENYPMYASKVHYLIHPIEKPFPVIEKSDYDYDLIIWGSIQPYKGIFEFLKFINSNIEFNKLRILVVGKCPDEVYLNLLKQECSGKVELIDKVLNLEEISILAQKSKFIFFPYNSPSLLSSGVLMDSLRMHSKILGPNAGSFKDLSYLSAVEVYDKFSEIKKFFTEDYNLGFNKSELEFFLSENTWDKFSLKFLNFYNNLN